MRTAVGLSALLIALLAQPALGLMHATTQQVDAGATSEGDADPLVRNAQLFLTADGTLAAEAPAEGRVVAPMALPGGESVALWATDAEHAAAFAGDTALALPLRVHLPALTASSAAVFTLSLLRAGEPVATAEAGPQLLLPGATTVFASLPTAGLAFEAGESLGLSVTARTLSTGPGAAPSLEYVVGPAGGNLTFALRYASLDALGHAHAPGDRHFLQQRDGAGLRLGDLGSGLWGLDLSIGTRGSPARLEIPAAASRVLLQVYHTPEGAQELPAAMRLELPGGATTLYRGEVLVRELPKPAAEAEVVCVEGCGERRTLALLAPLLPTVVHNGEPLQRHVVGPTDLAGAYAEAGWLLILFAPAGLMLAASIGYVMTRGGSWTPAPAVAARPRAVSRAPAAAVAQPRGGNGQRAGQPQAVQPRAVARRR